MINDITINDSYTPSTEYPYGIHISFPESTEEERLAAIIESEKLRIEEHEVTHNRLKENVAKLLIQGEERSVRESIEISERSEICEIKRRAALHALQVDYLKNRDIAASSPMPMPLLISVGRVNTSSPLPSENFRSSHDPYRYNDTCFNKQFFLSPFNAIER